MQSKLDGRHTSTSTLLALARLLPRPVRLASSESEDENLRWSPQVTSIVRRTAMKLRILRQIRHCLTVRQAMLYYSALVIPDTLYASNAFLPGLSAEQRNTVAKLDKRCIRCVADEHPLAHNLPLYTRLGVCPALERGAVVIPNCIARPADRHDHSRSVGTQPSPPPGPQCFWRMPTASSQLPTLEWPARLYEVHSICP